MKIGLIDADNIGKKSVFPNLALMKLSAYHKNNNDQVEWYSLDAHYNIVYVSKVFDFTPDLPIINNADKVIYGGCAYGLENKLINEIDHSYPDYSIYGITNKAYGFLTRGCHRNCGFCNVTQHQGKILHKVADLYEFWNDQRYICLLDPNIYACKDWKDLNQQLIDSKAYIDFTQGIDIRVMTPKKVEMFNKLHIDKCHFAWDNYEFDTYKKLKLFYPQMKVNRGNTNVYVLTNYNTTHEEDLERIYKLREINIDPYVMIYNKEKAPKITKSVQRWVNNRKIWRNTPKFEQYKKQNELLPDQLSLF